MDSENLTVRNADSKLDDKTLYAISLRERTNRQAWNTSNSFVFHSILDKAGIFFLMADMEYSLSDNETDNLQLDTMAWSTSRTFISSSGGDRNTSISGNMMFHIRFADRHTIKLSYLLNKANKRYDKTAIDNLTGEVDYSLTARYTNHSLTQKISAGYLYTDEQGLSIDANVSMGSNSMDKSEFLPQEQQYAKNYLDPLFYLTINKMVVMRSMISINYSNAPSYPSIEMVRPRIDNADPLFLRTGNPDLNRAMHHTLSFRMNRTMPALSASLEIVAMAKLTTDAISNKTRFFATEQPLTEYGGYIAPVGSTLLTFANVGNSFVADLSANYRFLCRPINSIILVAPTFNFEKTPGYTGEQLNTLELYHYGLKAGITANFSKKVKADLSSWASYDYMDNSQKDNMRGFTSQTTTQEDTSCSVSPTDSIRNTLVKSR